MVARSTKSETVRGKVNRLRDEKGLSFAQIGKLCGFSRQRAHQLYTEAGKVKVSTS